jgi:hypothetical protein
MAIFNSYVSLPEGNGGQHLEVASIQWPEEFPEKIG